MAGPEEQVSLQHLRGQPAAGMQFGETLRKQGPALGSSVGELVSPRRPWAEGACLSGWLGVGAHWLPSSPQAL